VPNLLIAFLAAALTALLVTPAVVRMSVARGVYGHSRIREGVQHKPVPRLGGVAVCIAMSIGVLAIAPMAARGAGAEGLRFFGGVLLAGWILFAAGLVDDLRGLRPSEKLLAQCMAALVAWAFGFRVEQLSLGDASLGIGLLSLPLTMLWVVGVTNAFNLIDGLDGLATGIALVALGTTFAVSAMLGNAEVALVCAALAGALLGFLRYNVRPARIFLGDSGSLFVGFMLAVLSVHGSTKSAAAVLAVVPVLVLALPLFDTGLAIVRRWLAGKPIFGADERHLHHRLVAIGLTHTRAVVLLFLLAAALATFGVVLAFAPPRAVTGIAVGGAAACLALLMFGIKRLGYHEFVEAGAVVTGGVSRLRRSIRDGIHARDVAQVIARAETVEHLRAILDDNAEVLGFLVLGFCRESSTACGRAELPAESVPRAWKLDFAIPGHGREAESPDAADPWVLRAWCDPEDRAAAPSPSRTARVLADAIHQWLDRGPAPIPTPGDKTPPHATPAPLRNAAA
jgi:UDP-GlcNAc:undecaprenyl-phosphate GlcNAc-1-phosphate transferase